MQALSNNHFSHDDQVRDVVKYIMLHNEEFANALGREYADIRPFLDGDEQVSGEYGSWLCDWIESNSSDYGPAIEWVDGEPYLMTWDKGDQFIITNGSGQVWTVGEPMTDDPQYTTGELRRNGDLYARGTFHLDNVERVLG